MHTIDNGHWRGQRIPAPLDYSRSDMEPVEDDLCFGNFKNEAELLSRLRARFEQGKFFSFVDDVVLFINPCKSLGDLDTTEKANNEEEIRHKDAVISLAKKVYCRLCHSGANQSVILTGVSGSGKTEITNRLIQVVLGVANSSKKFKDGFKQAAELLAAFGNRSTSWSDNASRFIKLTDILVNTNGHVIGGFINHYLLEKTKVCNSDKDEETFNIFNHVLLGMVDEGLRKFSLEKAAQER